MTTQQKPSRADVIRQRRVSQTASERVRKPSKPVSRQTSRTPRQSYKTDSIFLPVEPRLKKPTSHRQKIGVSVPSNTKRKPGQHSLGGYQGRMMKNPHEKGYDFSFSLGRTAVRTPLMSLPNLGSRWVSAGLTLLLGLMLYTMSTANIFKVTSVAVTGNQRLDIAEVSVTTDMIGQPIYKAVPFQIEKHLRDAFSDLKAVTVKVDFPNRLEVTVVERVPILAWYQDGKLTWIDPNGIAFTPRGEVPGLVQIASNGNPPVVPADQKSESDQPFIDPAMVQAILSLYPQVPGGATLVFDPKYGMGWQDPRGWSVYFGQTSQDIEMKKKIYQAILEKFSQQGIQPTLVSLAYLDAPFYK